MKNNTISIIRVTAMFMIILCHLASWLNVSVLAQVFNVGVEIFLLISGYLYSNHQINNPFKFIEKRWKKLCVPMYILVTVLLIYNIWIVKDYDVIKTIPVYILNLQGLGFLIWNFQMPNILGIGQLWFLTVIMLCYILLILVKKFEKDKFWSNKKRVSFVFAILLIVDCIFVLVGIQMGYFLVFFIGYAIGKLEIKIEKNLYAILSAMMVFSMLIRLIARNLIDGTIIYNNIIAILTHVVLAIWIYATIFFVYNKMRNFCDKVCKSALWKFVEEHSMLIYMTHYMFLIGNFNVAKLHIINIPVKICIFIICTIVSSVILKIMSDKLNKLINRLF